MTNQKVVFRYDKVQRDIARLRERVANELRLVGETHPNGLWTSGKKLVVIAAAVSEAVTAAIECDSGYDD